MVQERWLLVWERNRPVPLEWLLQTAFLLWRTLVVAARRFRQHSAFGRICRKGLRPYSALAVHRKCCIYWTKILIDTYDEWVCSLLWTKIIIDTYPEWGAHDGGMGYCLHLQTDGQVCSATRDAHFIGQKISIDTYGRWGAHRDG